MYYGLLVIMLPCALKITYSIVKGNPATAGVDNVAPRLMAAKLRATDKLYARLCAAEEHSFENAAFYFAGVLAAVQAGVEPSLVTDYASFWMVVRLAHTASYLSAWGGAAPLLGAVRTVTYIGAACASANMLKAAAFASSK